MLKSISLNSYWKLILDESNEGCGKNWHDHIPEGTENIWVPSCWNELKEEMLHYDNVAWYFKELIVREASNVKRNTLFFHGVNYACEIWVNGRHAGAHKGGFTPFEIDITNLVKYNENNLIAVRVDSRLDKFTIPPAGVDWFNYGGIFRDVCLNSTGESWIEDVTVVTGINGNIGITLEIGNFKTGVRYSVDVSIMDNESTDCVSNLNMSVVSQKCFIDIKLTDPKLWTLEKPFMYEFKIVLNKSGRPLDEWQHKIGIRELSVKGRKVLLNGKPVMLRGYSKHEEYPMLGRTFSYDIVRKDYEICKQGGCNFLRLCHYPHHLKEYEMASETGFLVIAEIPNLNFTREHFERDDVRENSLQQMKETLKYYKNETCIAFWSLFIECRTDENESVDFVKSYIDKVKNMDPTRLTIHASLHPAEDKTYDYFDIVGVNYWTGWYNGESIEEGSKLLDTVASRYPEKPLIMTSGGWEGIPGFHAYKANLKWSEEAQAEYLVALTEMYLTKEYIVGEILWTFNDFRVQPWFDPEKDWFRGWWAFRPMEMNFKGVLDFYRRPKLAYYKLQETFKKWDAKG